MTTYLNLATNEAIVLEGFDIDLDEAWHKIISRQFPGSPARGFQELIQNFVDAYPTATDYADRIARIWTTPNGIAIEDYGEGLSSERLALITTLGGTDKDRDPSKIGEFGMGFFAIFNPALGTRIVRVITRSDGETPVELVFSVLDPNKRPTISGRILDETPAFSTRIEITFDNTRSARLCRKAAEQCLEYYPCTVLINDRACRSVWHEAIGKTDVFGFEEQSCSGFIEPTYRTEPVATVLCKFERLGRSSMANLVVGRDGNNDLRDWLERNVPYCPRTHVVINSNNLSVTISRDGFYLDWQYNNMIEVLAKALIRNLDQALAQLPFDRAVGLIIANQYTLSRRLKTWLAKDGSSDEGSSASPEDQTLRRLAETPVYRLSGRRGLHSLVDIERMRTPEWPLFYSPGEINVRWLGGSFRHDFVILPPACDMGGGAPGLYQQIFGTLFDDAVNLDTIAHDQSTIARLVEKGIVSREALKPEVVTVRETDVSTEEEKFLVEVNKVLSHPAVAGAVAANLSVIAEGIQAVYFEVKNDEARVSVGLLGRNGEVADTRALGKRRTFKLGVDRRHPVIRHLVSSKDSHRAYFALTYIAHELPKAQRRLVPDTPEFHLVKRKLSADIRRGLVRALLDKRCANSGLNRRWWGLGRS